MGKHPKVKAFAKYPGAKWALAPWLVQFLPPRRIYVEPFLGSGGVFFNLPWQPKLAVLNDLNGEIVNLFQVMRDQPQQLAAAIALTPWAREEYRACMTPAAEPVERARRWLVTMTQGFGGRALQSNRKTGWRCCGVVMALEAGTHTTAMWRDVPQRLLEAAEMLRTAEIHNHPAIEICERYRHMDVLLYLDPPYVHGTRQDAQMYSHEMTDQDHVDLCAAIRLHPGPVVLSGYDCDLYKEHLPGWQAFHQRAVAEKGRKRVETAWLNPVALREYTGGRQALLPMEAAGYAG